MQNGAAKELERLVVGGLSDRGLFFEAAKSYAGPRRLTLAIGGLSAKQPDTSEERKGPRVGAPAKAIEGFLRAAGVTLDQCITQSDSKGSFYVAVIPSAGRSTEDLLAELLPQTLARMPWPKSMRWMRAPFAGCGRSEASSVRSMAISYPLLVQDLKAATPLAAIETSLRDP